MRRGNLCLFGQKWPVDTPEEVASPHLHCENPTNLNQASQWGPFEMAKCKDSQWLKYWVNNHSFQFL